MEIVIGACTVAVKYPMMGIFLIAWFYGMNPSIDYETYRDHAVEIFGQAKVDQLEKCYQDWEPLKEEDEK